MYRVESLVQDSMAAHDELEHSSTGQAKVGTGDDGRNHNSGHTLKSFYTLAIQSGKGLIMIVLCSHQALYIKDLVRMSRPQHPNTPFPP